ncbi:MAG: S9 family peptidase [Gemmatimonadota bacterium]|nr:S9 family peptidase [Gemmatimonadota bacterium]
MYRLLLTITFLILVAAPLSAQERGLQPTDFYNELTIQGVAISPTGELIAFTVMTINEEKNKRHREIWLQQLNDGQPAGGPFRFTDPTEESSNPRWSPDGKILSFTSKRGEDKNTTWFIRVSGPGGEAYHIDGVSGPPIWSPDGQWIAYTKRPDELDEDGKPIEKEKREGWIAPDAVSNTIDAKRFDGRVVTSIRYKRDGTLTFLAHRSVQNKLQLFVVPASGGGANQVTDLLYDVNGPVWTHDGSALLFSGNELQDDEYNLEYTTDLYVVSRSGGAVRKLTGNPGNDRGAAVSPKTDKLAYLFTKEYAAETDIMVVDIASDGSFKGSPVNITTEWDNRVSGLTWTLNGKALRFATGVKGNSHLFEISVGGGNVKQLTKGDRTLRSISMTKDGQWMAYSLTDAVTPTELYLAKTDGSMEQRLTNFNDDWLAEIKRRPAERLTWKVDDGSEIEGWVIKPVGYDPNKKYPLVLKIHGGPHGAYGNYFFRTFHVLSASGFFVMYPNPRGSTGYGNKFTYATRGKWGVMDSEDYLKGVEATIEKYPAIDPDRVGVSGGSYGGFMSNWLTATTDRFSASVTSRSITNWESWYGVSDAQGLTEREFYGTPWAERETYRLLSPISYVENVTAPTLIIHSENDYRTPIADGEQWFIALMKRKIPVELVRYPRSSHGLSRTGEPWLLVDRLERLRTWFVHWLIKKQGPATQSESLNGF